MAHGPRSRLVWEVIVVLGVIWPRPEAGQRRRPLLDTGGLLEKLLEPLVQLQADKLSPAVGGAGAALGLLWRRLDGGPAGV